MLNETDMEKEITEVFRMAFWFGIGLVRSASVLAAVFSRASLNYSGFFFSPSLEVLKVYIGGKMSFSVEILIFSQ